MATVKELQAKFVANASGLRAAFREIQTEASRLGPAVQRSTDQANKSFGSLNTSSTKLRRALHEAGQVDAFTDLERDIQQAQREIAATGRVSAETMATLERNVDGAGQHFQGLGDDARQGFSEIETAIAAVHSDLARLGSAGDLSNIRSDAGQAEGALDDLADAAQNAAGSLEDVDGGGFSDVADEAGGLSDVLGGLVGSGGSIMGVVGALGLVGAAGGGLAAAAGGLFALAKGGDDLQRTLNGMQAATGASATEMAGLKDSMATIYGNNYGESFQDIADSMTFVKQATGLSGIELEKMTKNGLMLRDTFQYEVNESVRAASGLMKNFGLSGDEAYALIAEGSQKGLNYADDLLDTINEYSVYYEQAGFSAQEMFGMFENAQKTGAFNLDYAADAFKEFGIIMTEDSTRAADALTKMGLPAEKLVADFAKGGESARGAFETIATKLADVKDPLDRTQIGIELFGTKFEDLGADAVVAMAKTNDSIKGTTDTLKAIDAIKYNSIGEAITGMGRAFTVEVLLPLQDRLMPILNDGFNKFRDFTEVAKIAFGALKEFLTGNETAADVLMSYGLDPENFDKIIQYGNLLQENLSKIRERAGQVFENIKTGFNTLRSNALPILETVAGAFMKVFDTVMPVIRPILTDVANFVGDTFKKIMAFWRSDGAQLVDAIKNAFDLILGVIKFIMPAVLAIIQTVWGNIKGVINGALDVIMGAVKIFSGLFTGDFKKMWEGIKQLFSGAVEFLWNFIQLTFYGRILAGAKTFIAAFRGGFATMWGALKTLFTGSTAGVLQTLKNGWDEMWAATKSVFTNIGNFLKDTWNSIKSLTSGAITAVKTVFTTGWNFISKTTSTVFNGIVTFFRTTFNLLRALVTTTLNTYRTLFTNGWNTISTTTRNVFNAVFTFFKTIFSSIANFLRTTTNTIWNGIKTVWNGILNTTKSVFNSVFNFLKGIFSNTWNTISTTVSNILSKITSTWNSVKTTTSRAFGDVFNAIKTKFNDIVRLASDLPGRIGTGIGNMASKVSSGITKVINTMARVLGKGVNGVIGGVNWVLDKLDAPNISTWRVPQWAHGTKNGAHPGGPMIVGDGVGSNAGQELIRTPDGKEFLSPAKPTLMSAPEGTRIWSATQTRELLASVPKYALGDLISQGKDAVLHAGAKLKNIGSAVKNAVFDIVSYIKNPSGLMDAALKALGIGSPGDSGVAGDIGRGAFKKAKTYAVAFVKKKMAAMGDLLTGGKGDGFPGLRKTSSYGMRFHPIEKRWKMHNGDDWGGPAGTLIPAQAAGQVMAAGYHSIRGNYVKIKSGNLQRVYQHNTRNLVSTGAMVKKGQAVGTVGETGSATGPHLHYEVLRNGAFINPAGYEDGGIVRSKQLAWIAEGGWAESIISHDPAKRSSQEAIWQHTGDSLGFNQGSLNKEILDALERIAAGVESESDRQIIMSDRIVGQLVEKHVTEQQELQNRRTAAFKGKGGIA